MTFSSTIADQSDDDAIFGAPSKPRGPIDFTAVHAMFNSAAKSGLKKPHFYAEDGLYLSLAPSTGANPGAIYVKQDDTYLGKIVDGKLKAATTIRPSVLDLLHMIAANPKDYAIAFGHKTGRCCICNITLTDPKSVARGIGPICAENYGFDGFEAVEVETANFAEPVVIESVRVVTTVNGGKTWIVDTDECVMEYVAGALKPFRTFIHNEKGQRYFEMFATLEKARAEFEANRTDRRKYLIGD